MVFIHHTHGHWGRASQPPLTTASVFIYLPSTTPKAGNSRSASRLSLTMASAFTFHLLHIMSLLSAPQYSCLPTTPKATLGRIQPASYHCLSLHLLSIKLMATLKPLSTASVLTFHQLHLRFLQACLPQDSNFYCLGIHLSSPTP